jgi:hypothetical protein
MSIAKQAAANRRNARRSSGPRSTAGKQRVSHNARRHGLSISITADRAFGEQIERLAREIAGGTQNELRLECARAVAAAELDLARVCQAKVALIERVMASGQQNTGSRSSSRSTRHAIGGAQPIGGSHQTRASGTREI